jgi:hypothetical protein
VVVTVLFIAALAIVFWWHYPRLTRVAEVDRAVVTRLSPSGNKGRQWVVTDAQDVQLLKDAVVGSVRIILENKCQPPEYDISLYRGEELILSVCPSPCCAIFHAEGALYQDRDGRFRAAFATVALE